MGAANTSLRQQVFICIMDKSEWEVRLPRKLKKLKKKRQARGGVKLCALPGMD